MHLIAFRRLEAGPLTTTMEHCRCQNHHDAPSSWLRRPSTRRGAGLGVLVAAAVLASIPAWAGARRPPAEILQAETA
jgi:hypothetical protein